MGYGELLLSNVHMIIGIVIFLITFYLIIRDKIPNTLSALAGGLLMIFIGILGEEKAFDAVDLEVIFLLVGMMIIVNIMSETGVFQWVAISIAQLVKGEPFQLMVLLVLITAVFSAFLDNVTTILLIAPVSILLAEQLEILPEYLVIPEILACNVGGTATLIGDPPNILIGSAAKLTFNEFLFNLGPIVVVNLGVLIITMWFIFGRKLEVSRDLRARIMELDPKRAIKDKVVLKKAIIIMGLVIIGFLTHSITKLAPSVIALGGAVALMLVTRKDPEEIFKTVEWKTLFFFIGLFILVEGLVEVGVIKLLADNALKVTNGNLAGTSTLILWLSAITSGIVDNIPYTATLIPMIQDEILPTIVKLNPDIDLQTVRYALWWSLSLGACFGGNATLLGSSANVVASGIMSKSGRKISFATFTKYGALITLETIAISNVYLFIRYL